jgi:pyruvate,orthophosphate dikinase
MPTATTMTRTRSGRRRRSGKPRRGRGSERFVYSFGDGRADGHKGLRNLLGGKGANLAEMSRMELPVPPGFTISTEVCTWYTTHDGSYPEALCGQVEKAMAQLERSMGRRFGDAQDPLLVSVRSGARVSMPGRMDTVLNLGLNDWTVAGLAHTSGNPRFAWDAYRRFVQMYADVVLGVTAEEGEEVSPFGAALDALKAKRKVTEDTELDADDLEGLVRTFKRIVKKRTGVDFPEDPAEQLWGAIGAVFESWDNERAVAYRAMEGIPGDWGTAVNVQAMVYGNVGEDCGTGVAFTRNPATGEKRFYGEYLMNAQGEDVVAGLRTPLPIARLEKSSPKAWRQLLRIQKQLEKHFRDMQDLEFTIEHGRLFMLQARAGKRTGFAAVRIAVEMVKEKLITKEEALMRVDPEALNQLLQPVFDSKQLRAARTKGDVLTKGLNAGPGAASGRIVFTAADAEAWARKKETVVLVRLETSPEDIKGMQAAVGILTARGGMTSHAALVARQMGKVCVAGAGELEIDYKKRALKVGRRRLKQGDWLSLDGTTGEVIAGKIATQPSEVVSVLFKKRGGAANRKRPAYQAFDKLMKWADEVRTLGVRANADQPDQCAVALTYGAKGIGLCRTEHMFFEGKKIDAVRQMILAEDAAGREKALAKLLPFQRRDFEGIFLAMAPHPVTIRTLDPPLHEFLPHEPAQIRALAKQMKVPAAKLAAKVASLTELNPMLGHRGCRLGIVYPEITAMQARAIFEAACNVKKKKRKTVLPEIMIPLVSTAKELEAQERIVREVAAAVFAEKKTTVPYLVGTMIELPRAALCADAIAQHAEFFSFGTNDLTQTTFGISRDDAGTFVPDYVEREIYPCDPFASLDVDGVGALMVIAAEKGRDARPGIKLGICGEHGGDPSSIQFCHRLGLGYVSCSPHRLPIARLAAAQAVLAR